MELTSLFSEQLNLEISLQSYCICLMSCTKTLDQSYPLKLSPSSSISFSRNNVTMFRSMSSRLSWLWQIFRTFSCASKVNTSFFQAKWVRQQKMQVTYFLTQAIAQLLKRSTNLVITPRCRIMWVAGPFLRARFESSQQASLLTSGLEQLRLRRMQSRMLEAMKVLVYSMLSATILPTILMASFLMVSFQAWMAAMITSLRPYYFIITSVTSFSMVSVSSNKVLKASYSLAMTKGKRWRYEILLSQMWLTSTQSCLGSFLTIFKISCSFPMILFPAVITAISLISTESASKQVGRSLSNSLTTVWKSQNYFSSMLARIHRDSYNICPYSYWFSVFLVLNNGWLFLRQKEMVWSERGGSGWGMGARMEQRMASITEGWQYLRQSSSSQVLRLCLNISALETKRKILAFSPSFDLTCGSVI